MTRLLRPLAQLRELVERARMIGEVAVAKVRVEVESPARPAAAAPVAPADVVDVVDVVTPEPAADAPIPSVDHGAPVPSAATLPISDYESLAAIHVVQRLTTLRPDELEQVRAFEQAHRARRTILAKIEHLQDADR